MHIAMKVDGVEKTPTFCANLFGYKHVNRVRREGKKGDPISGHMGDGSMSLTQIHYEDAESDEADFDGPAPCIHHIGIEVDDLDTFIVSIKQQGGEILTAPGHLPVKFRSPKDPVAEVVAIARWGKETLAAGVHGEFLA